jgi:transposase
MVILGIDAHKRTHTVVAIDEVGRQLGCRTTQATTTEVHLELVRWADRFGPERRWAVEDCRHLSRRLEADLLGAGEQIVRVPPKMMAHARDAARTYGKSDPIDALAVARATLREPGLPVAQLDGVGGLSAAKLVAETADVRRFRSKDAYARHNGTAPLPVWSSNRVRHRLSRTGNRQINAAIHRVAITQMRIHDGAKTYLERRMANGNTKTEALRALKRKLSDVIYRALLADATPFVTAGVGEAA